MYKLTRGFGGGLNSNERNKCVLLYFFLIQSFISPPIPNRYSIHAVRPPTIQLFNVESFNVESFKVDTFKVESFNIESFNVESFNVENHLT